LYPAGPVFETDSEKSKIIKECQTVSDVKTEA